MKVSFVLWDGLIGGAERSAVALAGEFRRRGVEATMLFIGSRDELWSQLEQEAVPAHHLGFARGAAVIRHPRVVARALGEQNADVAIVGAFGYLGAAIRAGGFGGVLIGVEHGGIMELDGAGLAKRVVRRADRASGVFAHDAEVALSEFMERMVRGRLHARRLVRIPHGVRLPHPAPEPRLPKRGELRVGYAGRLIPGKGLDVLIRSLATLREREHAVSLIVAGDGPSRPELERLAQNLDVFDQVEFLGWTDEIGTVWSQCDLAVAPNDRVDESFCLSIAEAMSYSRATVVTDRGALPELVVSGETGMVVPAGDIGALADAISRYAAAPERVRLHGHAARLRAERSYSLERCAERFLRLAEALMVRRESGRPDGDGGDERLSW